MRSCILFFLLLSFGCTPKPIVTTVNYKNYALNGDTAAAFDIDSMLRPYRQKMQKEMSVVIGFSNLNMYKKKPESLLGNFLVDAIKSLAETTYKTQVDIAVLNDAGYKGYLPKGEIQTGMFYTLLPYDNRLVLMEMSGTKLKQLLDYAASKGGWSFAGLSMAITANGAANIRVGNEPLDANKQYTIALSDYLANGGDGAKMLKGVPFKDVGFLVRDAFIQYTKKFTENGQPLSSQLEKRVYVTE